MTWSQAEIEEVAGAIHATWHMQAILLGKESWAQAAYNARKRAAECVHADPLGAAIFGLMELVTSREQSIARETEFAAWLLTSDAKEVYPQHESMCVESEKRRAERERERDHYRAVIAKLREHGLPAGTVLPDLLPDIDGACPECGLYQAELRAVREYVVCDACDAVLHVAPDGMALRRITLTEHALVPVELRERLAALDRLRSRGWNL